MVKTAGEQIIDGKQNHIEKHNICKAKQQRQNGVGKAKQ